MFKKNFSKIFILIAAFFLIVAVGVSLYYYKVFISPNIYTDNKEKTYINISQSVDTPDSVIKILQERVRVKNLNSLKKAIKKFQYATVRSGHYEVHNGMGNKELINMLQRGLQKPVRVTFNNIRTKEQLAGVLSKQLMPDSVSILTLLNDSEYLARYGLNPENVLVTFIPNTYEFFWNVDEGKIFERMYREYEKFWTPERREKATEIPLTPIEVSILASIVEEETNKSYEYSTVAGLYVNRLKRKIPLQADPTVKYAIGDFEIRRVLNVHLDIDSPYNTYRYRGLPPGPIRIPSVQTIDAVLNYEEHNYIYMVAKETLNGEHNFASTLREHNNNANKYRRALNRLNIYN
ncbi:endolytic transglycosylase MltG [Paludibacter sp. 221]|uniref:endolytic transglycosylase MltG n=1 Tax=Paludibacter sp. 221 TaxID=2302939 RepID=UPI0013D899B3|nr:endolytic transglycosylase MltG [Paludibacter sp. 221]NDV46779.1 endolytic transglycosylase MltG [Paludibacter sp. 221]